MVREEVPAQAVFRLHTCGRWGKKCERIEWTIVLCRLCYPRGGSSPRATEENADVQSESNVTICSLPRAAEENADIQSESNVNNSASASAVNAVVQAGTLEEPLTGPQVPGKMSRQPGCNAANCQKRTQVEQSSVLCTCCRYWPHASRESCA